jgi:hypothetical protein
VAGRSYHGAEGSPWREGRTYGASLADFCDIMLDSAEVETVEDWVPLVRAFRRLEMSSRLKYDLSSQRSRSASSFFLCFGIPSKAAAEAIMLGKCDAQAVLSLLLSSGPRVDTWWATSLTMYSMCNLFLLMLGFDPLLSTWLLDNAARYFPSEAVRALDEAALCMIQSLQV